MPHLGRDQDKDLGTFSRTILKKQDDLRQKVSFSRTILKKQDLRQKVALLVEPS